MTPKLEGVDFVAAPLREVDTTFFWQMRRCNDVRSLPDIELIFSDIVAGFDRQHPVVTK